MTIRSAKLFLCRFFFDPYFYNTRRSIILLLLVTGIVASHLVVAQTQTTQTQTSQPQISNESSTGQVPEFAKQADIYAWQADLQKIAGELENSQLAENQLDRLGQQLDALIAEAEHHKTAVAAELAGPQAELEALGPAPEDGEVKETAEIAAQREAINARLSAITARVKQAELAVTQAEELLSKISMLRSERLGRHLFTRGAPIFSADVWRAAASELITIASALSDAVRQHWQPALLPRHWPDLLWIAVAGTITLLGIWLLGRWLLRRYGRSLSMAKPSYSKRILTAFIEGLARGVLPSLAIVLLILLIIWRADISNLSLDILAGLASGLVFYITVRALIRAALVPDATFWRIVPVNSMRARKLSRRLRLLSAVCSIFLALFIATTRFQPYGEEFYTLVNLTFSGVIALLLSTLLKKGLWQTSADDSAINEEAARVDLQRKLWAMVRLGLLGLLFITLGLALYGYSNLAGFTLSRIVLSAVVLGGLLMLRRLLHDLLEQLYMLFYPPAPVTTGPTLPGTDEDQALAPFWLGLVMDFLILIPSLILLLSFWGVPQTTVYLWGRNILEGFTVGELTFSLGRILLALLVFGVVFLITRVLRGLIRDQLLTRTHLDSGIKDSLSIGIVYLGSTIALLLAVAALGVSLTNLALIFGALSVGVGLGLQNVVNNFVSGMVLLIQRPVKVGDWIVVGPHEGNVKNVNVISTEIETFDKASILIPNSDIISNALVNWTHNDRTIRVTITIGVAYGSDTRQVHDLLLECAERHDSVLSIPKSYVLFTDFADSALLFELRVYVGNVDNYYIVASDLRFDIEWTLREADITIPFPQRELHVKPIPDGISDLNIEKIDGKEINPQKKIIK